MHPLVFSSLEPLLPSGYTLVGNQEARVLSLLAPLPSEKEDAQQQGRLIAQEQMTPTEWRILLALIDAYPSYASYARLLAVLTSSSLEACQHRLQEARAEGNKALKHLLHPLRKALAVLRPRLEHLGLRVVSVQARGYVLDGLTENGLSKQVS